MREQFFELIRFSIGTGGELSSRPSTIEWEELYRMARKHTLLGICFAGISKYKELMRQTGEEFVIPKTVYDKWIVAASQIVCQNELVDKRCVELQGIVEKAGFSSFIMKGQGNALLYGELSKLRQCGDIDIYVDGGYKKVMDFVNRNHPTREVNELEIHYPCFFDVEVEIHFKPFVMDGPKNRILQSFFKKEQVSCYNNKSVIGFTVPTSQFNVIHQLVHIHHHLFYEGVGLRQLMDYYYLLKSIDVNEINVKVVKELGLNRFASALMWVLGYVFGLEHEKMLWESCEADGRMLLREIMISGNFGKFDYRQKNLYNSKWNSFWIVYLKNFRLWRFDYWAWFWSPIYRIKAFLWRKLHGYN